MGEVTQTPRVLAVDDSKMNHSALRKTIGDQYDLVSVYSGQACLDELAKTGSPDLILLDVTMPEMDGFETCEAIKSQPQYRNLPVLFLSGRCSIEEKVKGYEAGADDYITKPFVEEELRAKIQKNIVAKKSQEKLTDRANQATQVAKKVIKMSSSIGTCMRFLGASMQKHSIEELASLFFASADELGLSTTLRIRLDDREDMTFFEDGYERELETALLSSVNTDKVFIDAGRRVIVNFDHVTVLIKNMPIDDERDHNGLKDYVLALIEGFQSRLQSINSAFALTRQKQMLTKVLGKTTEVVSQSGANFHELMKQSQIIVEDIVQQMEGVIPTINMDEYQEKELFGVTTRGLERMEALHSKLLIEDEQIAKLSKDLSAINQASSEKKSN